MYHNGKFHRLSPAAVNRGELGKRVFNACFCHLPLCFQLKFYTSIKLCLQNTLLNVNKKGGEVSLCKPSNPKCFKTTDFDRFP